MDESERAKYRKLVERECDEMRCAAEIWGRVDISRDEKLRLFDEAQFRIQKCEQDAKLYIESIIGRAS